MKKIVTLLMAVFMLVSCLGLSSCKEDPPQPEKGTEDYTAPPSAEDLLGFPSELRFDGEFSVLTPVFGIPEFGDPTLSDQDPVEQSLLERDYFVEDRLGITFQYTSIPGAFNDRQSYSDHVRQSVQAGVKAWDMVATYSMVAPNLALNNSLVDMRTLDYIDFEKTWYPQFMVESSTINNKTYFISGDISTNMLYQMHTVAFSEKQATAKGINEDDLYQMVYDNKWTVENWFKMCQDLGEEIGGDGVWDKNDYYPIISSSEVWLDSFYFATGLSLIEEGNDGKLVVSTDPLDEPILEIYATLFDAQESYHSFRVFSDAKAIMNEKCIFAITTVASFRNYFVDANEQYRVLPFPKYIEGDSTSYQTLLSFGHTQYCIPNDIDDPNRSAAVLEALGYAGYVYVTPVVFEETMQMRYSENENVSNMFEIMRTGRTYDVASLFYMMFGANGSKEAHMMFRAAVVNKLTNWTSNYKQTYEPGLNTVVGKLNEFYSK
ncbi:MAG: hypothetical protein IJZ80_04565 [Clostridia bacterium]|nr:hypothetical protein [Clostridia bacterium]